MTHLDFFFCAWQLCHVRAHARTLTCFKILWGQTSIYIPDKSNTKRSIGLLAFTHELQTLLPTKQPPISNTPSQLTLKVKHSFIWMKI